MEDALSEVAYAPVDVPKPVTDDVLIVDSGPMHLGPAVFPIRMTIIRLPDGTLLLHSPTRFDFELRQQLEQIGPIRHLVAPNTGHWTHVADWQAHVPEAMTWAAPGLRKRPAVQRAGMRVDRVLADGEPPEWAGAIEVVVVRGRPLVEAALFHRPSWTLVLTDLVVNIEPNKLPPLAAMGARMLGATAPDGRAPIYSRMAFKAGGTEARQAGERLVALAPERVIFSHGRWYERDATAQLRKSLSWLTG